MTASGDGLVVFANSRRRFAVAVRQVERVLPGVALAALPGAPETVAGLLNLHAEIVPVLDLGRHFGDPAASLTSASQLILLTGARRLALLADRVESVAAILPGRQEDASALGFGLGRVARLVADDGGLVYLYEPVGLLTSAEEAGLAAALAARAA